MRTGYYESVKNLFVWYVGMKPLSERDENSYSAPARMRLSSIVGMKPLSERDENLLTTVTGYLPVSM